MGILIPIGQEYYHVPCLRGRNQVKEGIDEYLLAIVQRGLHGHAYHIGGHPQEDVQYHRYEDRRKDAEQPAEDFPHMGRAYFLFASVKAETSVFRHTTIPDERKGQLPE
jgi:hypothetical protein